MSKIGHICVEAGVVCCSVSGETVILDQASGRYYGLNETASRIWNLLREGDLDSAVEALSDEYETDPDDWPRILDSFVEELAALQLISRH